MKQLLLKNELGFRIDFKTRGNFNSELLVFSELITSTVSVTSAVDEFKTSELMD
jgi:hypothetical protein